MNPSSFPPPFSMCSREECHQRQEEHQVSSWESTQDTCSLQVNKRVLDPQLAVAKYRRSAAGSTQQRPPRTLPQLLTSWKHLLGIFTTQQVHHQSPNKSLLTGAVSFLDDRIRAIQVDLVLSQTSCSELQLQLIHYQVLSSYLLCQVPRKVYEPKFARQALWTALSAYWNDNDNDEHTNVEHDDLVLCYTALCQLATCIVQQEQGVGGGWQDSNTTSSSFGNILLLQKHCSSPLFRQDYPKFQFALQLTSAAMLGFHRNVLSMLFDTNEQHSNKNFMTVAKCCMAPAFFTLRLNALRHYNKAFGKLEHISGKELARLLYLSSAETALEFATAVGLPVENGAVILKSAPISVSNPETTLCWTRQEDWLVFGSSSGIQHDEESRIDEDGVSIPPSCLLQDLIENLD